MLDVSAKLVDVAIKQFRVSGLNVSQLAQGLALPGVTNDDSFAEWNDVTEFFARADESIGGRGRMVELSESAAVAALPEGQLLMALSPDVPTGIHLINRLADATFGPAIRYPTFRKIGPQRFHLQLRHPQARGYRANAPYFQGMPGAFRAAPRSAATNASAPVTTPLQPYRPDYEIELPPYPL